MVPFDGLAFFGENDFEDDFEAKEHDGIENAEGDAEENTEDEALLVGFDVGEEADEGNLGSTEKLGRGKTGDVFVREFLDGLVGHACGSIRESVVSIQTGGWGYYCSGERGEGDYLSLR